MTTHAAWISLSLTLLFLSACSERKHTFPADSAKAPVSVQSITAQMREVPLLYTASGSVHARTESQLASQTMARVLAVSVNVGDHVRAGQTLVSLDAQESTAGYHKAEAGRAESQSALAESDSSVAQAKANLDLAQVTNERMTDLFSKRSISKQEMDESSAKLKNAQAAYDMARARREQLNNRIAQNDAAIQEAQTTRGYSTIRAPFAGIVTARSVEPGTMAVPGAPLLTIESGTGYRLHASVEESHISQIHINESVKVFIDALQNEVNGRVAEISPISDANAHSFTVKIDLPSNAALRAGQYGHVSFAMGSKQGMTIPSNAVIEHGQLQSVMVADHGVARIRLVTLGAVHDGQAEVLSGLQADDRVIIAVPVGLADGDRVEARP